MTRPNSTKIVRAAPAALAVAALALSLAACKKEAAPPEVVATASETSEATEVAEMSVEDWIRTNYKDAVSSDLGTLQYATAEVDLDGDGTPEVLAYLGGPMMCGTGGCNLVVLKRDGTGFRKMGEVSVVQLPVGVLDSKSHGWRDLAVTVSGGGMPEGTKRLPFDGKAYPENATVQPAGDSDTIGKTLISADDLKPFE
ncbi:hypothetical protein WBP07_00330 [Novosphingobium sp. BL-8A]|uniref:hypothetical protein n=1 Tax=Novosphingobium sp. BL-8A TaxID=3127639 RepID=UPI00375812F1